MAGRSKIEWTEVTWNPVTGCTKISDGCAHCYAERFARRLQASGNRRYKNGFTVTLHPDLIETPKRWVAPRLIFVNSMSDLFHEDVPDEFIREVFGTMTATPQHTFQILTKRSERLQDMASSLSWPANVWAGVTIESSEYLYRVDHLRSVPAKVRFLSLEPLLGPLSDLSLSGIDWLIVGGESGPGARGMDPLWVEEIRDLAIECNVPFFFKQWGGVRKNAAGRILDGRTWDEMPAVSGT